MTDADTTAAFLAEIIAHPADDGPRLTFADWCEEHGQCERAELIRVQVELAEYDNVVFLDTGITELAPDKLRRRAAELLAQHGVSWIKEALWLE